MNTQAKLRQHIILGRLSKRFANGKRRVLQRILSSPVDCKQDCNQSNVDHRKNPNALCNHLFFNRCELLLHVIRNRPRFVGCHSLEIVKSRCHGKKIRQVVKGLVKGIHLREIFIQSQAMGDIRFLAKDSWAHSGKALKILDKGAFLSSCENRFVETADGANTVSRAEKFTTCAAA